MQPTDETTEPLPESGGAVKPDITPEQKKRWAEMRQRIEICKHYRKKLIRNWTTNIDYRRGKEFSSQTDDDTISVNLDWSYTKTKQAALFSQVPKVHVTHSPESLTTPWIPPFERTLNDTLVTSGIEAAMDECLPDCINAAGIGIVLVAREAITEEKEVPAIDLSIFPAEIQAQALQTGMLFGQPIPMETVPQAIDSRYVIRRISPSNFLWPTDFTGSDFNNAPWLGYSDSITWAEAKQRFKLTDEDKPEVQSDERTVEDKLSHDYDRERSDDDGKVGFDEIFYHEFQYNPDARSYKTIHHLVFLHGRSKPVIDGPWEGQVEHEGQLIGALKKPLQVLTLAYVTDEDIPPSDSAVARSQVNELNRGRSHIAKQRARNAPWTWFDVNRLDPAIQQALMRGTWQHAVPVQGDGSRVLGTVQVPAMHQENFLFDKIAKQDAQELWTIGPNQQSAGGEGVETKGEASVIQENFMTKVGRERARVASFVTHIAEVLGGLICLYEDPSAFGEGFDPTFSAKLSYSILTDSTVLVTAEQRLDRLDNFVNRYAKSGYVNLEPVLKEIATLTGLDPNTVIVKPEPAKPELPNISLRLTGGEDMMNPLLLAFMIKAGQAPDQQSIAQAKELIQSSVQIPDPNTPPQGPLPPAPPVGVGEANPNMGLLPPITQRSNEGGSPEDM